MVGYLLSMGGARICLQGGKGVAKGRAWGTAMHRLQGGVPHNISKCTILYLKKDRCFVASYQM